MVLIYNKVQRRNPLKLDEPAKWYPVSSNTPGPKPGCNRSECPDAIGLNARLFLSERSEHLGLAFRIGQV